MNDEDIREIVKLYLADIGIEMNDNHYNIAKAYYNETNIIPTPDFIICKMMLDSQDNNYEPYIHPINRSDIENYIENPEDFVESDSNGENYSSVSNDESNEVSDDESDETDETDESMYEHVPALEYQLHDLQYGHVNHISQLDENSQIQFIAENTLSLDVKKVLKNIDDIQLAMFKNIENVNSNNECLICYDLFVPTDIIRILPCSHIFHRCCIDTQLKTQCYLCPYCKSATGEYVYHNL